MKKVLLITAILFLPITTSAELGLNLQNDNSRKFKDTVMITVEQYPEYRTISKKVIAKLKILEEQFDNDDYNKRVNRVNEKLNRYLLVLEKNFKLWELSVVEKGRLEREIRIIKIILSLNFEIV